ncbi:MAG: STAS domain-containing protein [Oscillochloris sp.]|nr:STAS domain-containing protein [Oscillochloris sp.]
MDIRARTLIAFIPLIILLASMVIALPIIEQRNESIHESQIDSESDLTTTQMIGMNLLFEHTAVGDIAQASISPQSERYTTPHNQLAELFQAYNQQDRPAPALDQQVATLYTEIGIRYTEIIALARDGKLAMARQMYGDPKTHDLLDQLITVNQQAQDAALVVIEQTNLQAKTTQRRTFQMITVALSTVFILTIGLSWMLIAQIIRPIDQLTKDTERHTNGEISGPLSAVHNISQLRRLRNAFQTLLDTNEERQKRIQQDFAELGDRIAREERLRETVDALSVPLIPLQENMLLLPLIGHLDTRRTTKITNDLLEAIHQRRAKAVVLDITGLANLDKNSIMALNQTINAARLLGCQVFLVGVRADQAVNLTESQITTGINIARDIPSVLDLARTMV